MNKSNILIKLSEIAQALPSPVAQQAIAVLKKEVENSGGIKAGSERAEKNHVQLPLPSEILGHKSRVALFTDGACRGNPGPGSWAYLAQDHHGELLTQRAACEEHTTNNKMELKAIIFGLKDLMMAYPKSEIWVYTDSKYVVDGMKSWVAGWKKRGWKKADKKAPENLDLWQELDELNSKGRIIFNWVKGHSGHPQNEYADQLANKELDANGF